MINLFAKVLFMFSLVAYAGSGSTQETDSAAVAEVDAVAEADAATQADDSDAAPEAVKNCFNATRARDINVLNDQYVYVRTYGNNQYLLTLGRVCDGLHRRYIIGGVTIQPMGRDVCTGDGSHLVYDASGRLSMCPIGTVEPVEDRAEARAIAANGRAEVEMEEISLSD